MKMYILLKEQVPDHLAPVIAAHAALACYRQYEQDADMQTWINSVFKKVVCRVNDKEYARARECDRFTELHESAIGPEPVCLVFCPRPEYPKAFSYYRMWRPAVIS